MPSWSPEAQITHPLDYRLVCNGPIAMFWRSEVLDQTVTWLVDHGYDVVDLDAASWHSAQGMFAGLAAGLHFPDYFGHNFDALVDCLRDVAAGDYGWRRQSTGVVIVLRSFDAFVSADPDSAWTTLDCIAGSARSAILIGNRMLCLLQSDNPRLNPGPVGATPVLWNDAEWLDFNRGL